MSLKKKKGGGQSGWEQVDCEEPLVCASCIFSGDSLASWWWGHTRWKWNPRKSTFVIQHVKESIPSLFFSFDVISWTSELRSQPRSYHGRRAPHALWLCWNGAVTSLPLRSDTSALSRQQKPINNVNDGSDLFGCPRKQQQWAIMHINCALLGWSHYRSY